MKTTDQLLFDIDGLSIEMAMMIKLSHLQSISEPNVFWVKSISPIILEDIVVDFLFEHREKFTRKLSARELLNMDCVIRCHNPKTFSEFKNIMAS